MRSLSEVAWAAGTMLRSRFTPLACKEASMARANLRIYRGPETKPPVPPASPPAPVTENVGEVLPLLADATASKPLWLSVFENDKTTITADLYEVLLAY